MKVLLLLALLIAIGCADDSPNPTESVEEDVFVSDVATLIETLPASGELAAYDEPVVLYFNKRPLSVSVNGTPAKVKGNLACWDIPNQKTGTKSLRIEWTNPDGTTSVGPEVWLKVAHVSRIVMYLRDGSISEGDHVDPDDFNEHFIQYSFTKRAVGVMAKLASENGNDLGWEAVWEDSKFPTILKLHRGENGKLLEKGKRYRIEIVVDEAWIYKTDMCECMKCSEYKNHRFTIPFMTIPVDAE